MISGVTYNRKTKQDVSVKLRFEGDHHVRHQTANLPRRRGSQA
jgi:hypothetical protein